METEKNIINAINIIKTEKNIIYAINIMKTEKDHLRN